MCGHTKRDSIRNKVILERWEWPVADRGQDEGCQLRWFKHDKRRCNYALVRRSES